MILVIPTVASQSVLCWDLLLFSVVFFIHEIYIRKRKQWCLRLTVCHFHVQNSYYSTVKVNIVFHSMASLKEEQITAKHTQSQKTHYYHCIPHGNHAKVL